MELKTYFHIKRKWLLIFAVSLLVLQSISEAQQYSTPNGLVTKIFNNTVFDPLGVAPPSFRQSGFSGDGGPAQDAQFRMDHMSGIASDAAGNLYIADTYNHRIRKVDLIGRITTIAGSGAVGQGNGGFGGDGGLATNALLNAPIDVAVDNAGNIYIVDYGNNRIRKVNAADGAISTIAGNGSAVYNGDGQATAVGLPELGAITIASDGKPYIAFDMGQRFAVIDPGSGALITVISQSQSPHHTAYGVEGLVNGVSTIYRIGNLLHDGNPLQPGPISWVDNGGGFGLAAARGGIDLDPIGNIYFNAMRDASFKKYLYKLNTTTNQILRSAGHPSATAANNIPAYNSGIQNLTDLVIDSQGTAYIIGDNGPGGSGQIRKIDQTTGYLNSVYDGPATKAAFDPSDNLYVYHTLGSDPTPEINKLTYAPIPVAIRPIHSRTLELGSNTTFSHPISTPSYQVFEDVDGDPMVFSATSSNTAVATESVDPSPLGGDQLTVEGLTLGSTEILLQADDGQDGVGFNLFTINIIENTRPGNSIAVFPKDTQTGSQNPNTHLIFSQVDQAGVTTLTTSLIGPQPPLWLNREGVTYYDFNTTASFSSLIEVCIPDDHGTPSYNPQLFRYDSGTWVDITTTRDPQVKICGNTSSLSLFATFPFGNPPVGTNKVTVITPTGSGDNNHDVQIQFSEVLQAGESHATTSTSGIAPPTGFKTSNPPNFYDIATTATFTPPAQVCVGYDETTFANESDTQFFHYEAGNWVEITSARNTGDNLICGNTNTLSPFAVFEIDSASPGNSPPVISNPIPGQSLQIGTPFTLDLSAAPAVFSDADGDQLIYTTNSSSPPIATANIAGNILTVDPLATGNSTISVTANDGNGGTVQTTFLVVIGGTVNYITDDFIDFNDLNALSGMYGSTPTDPTFDLDGNNLMDNVEYFVYGDNFGQHISGMVIPSPLGSGPGPFTNAGATLGFTTPSILNNIGAGQQVSVGLNGSGLVGVKQVKVTLEVDPPSAFDLASTSLAAHASLSAIGPLFPASNLIEGAAIAVSTPIDGDSPLETFTLTMAPGFTTSTGATVRVKEIAVGASSTTQDKFDEAALNLTLTINGGASGNSPPVVSNPIPNQSLEAVASPFTRDLTQVPVVFTDPDADPLSYSVTSSNISAATANITGNTLTVTPVSVGSATITITADDNQGGTVQTTFTMTVTAPAPSASIIAHIDNADLPTIDGDISDWEALFANPHLAQVDFTSISGAINGPVPEADQKVEVWTGWNEQTNLLYIAARVHDDFFGTETSGSPNNTWKSDNIEVFIDADHSGGSYGGGNATAQQYILTPGLYQGAVLFPEVLTNPPQVQSAVSKTDNPDGTFTYQYEMAIPGWNIIDGSGNGTQHNFNGGSTIGLSFGFADFESDAEADANSYHAYNSLYGTQGAHNNADAMPEFQLGPSSPGGNIPPTVANPIADQNLDEGGSTFVLDLSATPAVFNDANGDPLIYSASSADPGVATASIASNILTVSPIAAGSTTITVTADDNNGGTAQTTFTVSVTAPPPQSFDGRNLVHIENADLPTIDGDISDWEALFANPHLAQVDFTSISGAINGPVPEADQKVEVWAGWNEQSNLFYIAARVHDDFFGTETSGSPNNTWKSDNIEVFIDADHSGGSYGSGNATAQQYILTPGLY